MGRIRHKRTHHARRDVSRGMRTRARKLDPDQIVENIEDEGKRQRLLHPDHLDIDKPGLGLFYCLECDRHFPSEQDRAKHQQSKLHKRIAKRTRTEKPYTVEESLRAAGIGIDNKQRSSPPPSLQQRQNGNAAINTDQDAVMSANGNGK